MIDKDKTGKIEAILRTCNLGERQHLSLFLQRTILGEGVTPETIVTTVAAPPPTTFRDLEQEAMRQFSMGELVEFTNSKTGAVIQGRVARFNQRTIGLDNRWRVSPQFLRKVTTPAKAAPPSSSPARPTASSAGTW
jgi:hypothetical protein